MHPFLLEIFGRRIPSYGVCMLIGAFAAWFLARRLAGKNNNDISQAFLICIAGGLAGLVSLRPIIRIPEVIINWERFRLMPVESFLSYVFGELVFYGGLIGGALALVLFCTKFRIQILPVADVLAPALALAHGIGRIGCFLGGCCFGVPVSSTHPFAVVFPPQSLSAPSGVPLLAVQLIESACLIALCGLLIIVYRKTSRAGMSLILYCLIYSVARFVLEFYRGDIGRGIYGPFSTSQYISFVLFAAGIVLLFLTTRKKTRAMM